MEDRLSLVVRQGGGEECGPLAFGEAGLACPATQEASGLAGSVASDDVEISGVTFAPVGALKIAVVIQGNLKQCRISNWDKGLWRTNH